MMSWLRVRKMQSDVTVGFAIAGAAGVFAILYLAFHKSRAGGWLSSLPSLLSPSRLLLLSLSLLSVSFLSLSQRRRRRPVRLVISANQRPELATQKAITHIIHGDITTLGELVYFFRGQNEKQILLDKVHYAYLQRTFPTSLSLSTTADSTTDAANTTAITGVPPKVAWLLQRLIRCNAQAERLQAERATPFNPTNPTDNQLLWELWLAAGLPPDEFAPHSPAWADLGFQGRDPTTDLRGGGVLALRQLVHFAQTHNDAFMEMMAFNKKALAAGEHHWYLLAVVSIHFTAKLLLQEECNMGLPQLEVLYSTAKKQEKGEKKGKDDVVCSDHVGKVRAPGLEQSTSQSNDSNGGNNNIENEKNSSWRMDESESDFEEGFFTLHHQLLLHFKRCWHRDRPHVMDYNKYIPSVYESFICESADSVNAEETANDTC